MYKYEENTYLFSKNDIVEALKSTFEIKGYLTDIQFAPYKVKNDDRNFLEIKTKRELGDSNIIGIPELLEEGSLD